MGRKTGGQRTQLPIMSLVTGEKSNFQYILRLLNTNVEGKQKVMYALTKMGGVGRRYSNLVCKKADVDLTKRAGELTSEELERIVTIIQTQLNTRSHPGSSIVNAISSMARTRKFSPTVSTPSFVMIWSARRRSVLIVVSVITGVSVSVDNTQRPLGVVAGLSVSPRRRVVKRVVPWDKLAGWSVAFRFHAVHMAFLHFSMRQKTGCILPHLVD